MISHQTLGRESLKLRGMNLDYRPGSLIRELGSRKYVALFPF